MSDPTQIVGVVLIMLLPNAVAIANIRRTDWQSLVGAIVQMLLFIDGRERKMHD